MKEISIEGHEINILGIRFQLKITHFICILIFIVILYNLFITIFGDLTNGMNFFENTIEKIVNILNNILQLLLNLKDNSNIFSNNENFSNEGFNSVQNLNISDVNNAVNTTVLNTKENDSSTVIIDSLINYFSVQLIANSDRKVVKRVKKEAS